MDLRIWIEVRGNVPVLLHTFYKKDVSSRYTILKRLAMSMAIKRTTMIQEALRRLRNMSPELSWEYAKPHMNKFSNILRVSGYSEAYRHQIMNGAIKRMIQCKRKVSNGEWESLYRTREAITMVKEEKGGCSTATWFLKGQTTSTITCTATPNSLLQSMIKEKMTSVEQADKGKTLVMEDGGVPATLGLKLRDPFRRPTCRFMDPNCMVDPTVDCSQQDQCYIVTCNTCQVDIAMKVRPKQTMLA